MEEHVCLYIDPHKIQHYCISINFTQSNNDSEGYTFYYFVHNIDLQLLLFHVVLNMHWLSLPQLYS